MRIVAMASAALLLSLPALTPAKACGAKHSAQITTQTLSAEETKPPKKKVVKKAAQMKEKVEYLRAAVPEPEKKK